MLSIPLVYTKDRRRHITMIILYTLKQPSSSSDKIRAVCPGLVEDYI